MFSKQRDGILILSLLCAKDGDVEGDDGTWRRWHAATVTEEMMVGSGAAVVHGCVLATTSVRRCQGAASAVGMFFSVSASSQSFFFFFGQKRWGGVIWLGFD